MRTPLPVLLLSQAFIWAGVLCSEKGLYWEGVGFVWAGTLMVVWPDLARIHAKARSFVRGHHGPICF